MSEVLAPLAVQWRAEKRILSADKRRIERRIAELEEMLETFFGDKPNG